MPINMLTTTAKKYYEDLPLQGKQIDEVLFPTLDESMNATVKIDTYTGGPFAARAITKGAASKVRAYQAGDGFEYEPPLTKEKTAIDETLRDSVIAGIDEKSPAARHLQQAVRQIISGPKGFISAHRMARNKAALDVYLEGKFRVVDEDTTVKEIDYQRDSALSINVTAATKFDAGIASAYNQLSKKGFPGAAMTVILGANWLQKFNSDAAVLEKRKATRAIAYSNENGRPPLFEGAEGLYVIDPMYNVDGIPVPIRILTYAPPWPYMDRLAGTPADFVPADKAIVFDAGGMAFRCNRGVDVIGADGRIVREVGDMVIDSFKTDDPPVEWIRSTGRFIYVRGNINHTAVLTLGT